MTITKQKQQKLKKSTRDYSRDPQEQKVDFPIRLPRWMATKIDEMRAYTGHTRAEYVMIALVARYGSNR